MPTAGPMSLKRDWWLIAILISFGVVTFAGFIAAWRIFPKRIDALLAAIVTFIAAVAGILLLALGEETGSRVLAYTWLASIPYALFLAATGSRSNDEGVEIDRPPIGARSVKSAQVGGVSGLFVFAIDLIFALMIAMCIILVVALAQDPADPNSTPGAFVGIGIFAVGITAVGLFCHRVSSTGVRVSAERVEVRNPVRTLRFRPDEIREAELVDGQPILRLRNGKSIRLVGLTLLGSLASRNRYVAEGIRELNRRLESVRSSVA